jgi:hypothetical protein
VSTYLVAGGIFQDLEGNELFTLLCPSTGDLPYVMADGQKPFFKMIWQNAHLYQVEEDYSLTLAALSPEAVEWGIKAPERVTPDKNLFEKLKAVLQEKQIPPEPLGTSLV